MFNDRGKVKRTDTIRLSAVHLESVAEIAKRAGVKRAKIYRRAIVKYCSAPPETVAEILSTQ